MKDSDERIVALLQEARRQLEVERRRREEPIAIVGIGCRFPGGVSNPEQLWSLLREGVDATSEVPGDRWSVDAFYDPDPETPGVAYTRRGSFLQGVEEFDPAFFGISPREALAMDPQQRLLLEVVWEALEDARVPAEKLRGTATGVWVGQCVDDYSRRSVWSNDPAAIDAYSALGNTRSIAAGRISYVLDLRGPAVQLDTACSSSLVAVHLACQSLRARECDLALAGGVNVMSAPESTIALCKLRALATDGRCKTFDAAADGYGRGEGCGVVLLKRASDALAAGDRIYALIRGSAVNHDGHSNGLTAPNGLAQEAVLRAALSNAGLAAADVSFVEAHGTGTLLGDPIEVLALSRVYGDQRGAQEPLRLGTVKTNFGHLEGAAGVAGLIKLALCLWHGQLVANLHFKVPNPKIPWASLPVQVVTEAQRWEVNGKPRIGGVSSFGISGTNVHALLQEAPAEAVSDAPEPRSAELVVLSARGAEALPSVARRLRQQLLEQPQLTLAELAYSLVTTREVFEQRIAASVTSREELLNVLQAVESGAAGPGTAGAVSSAQRGKLAWLLTGQGAQQAGMGRGLYREWPAFRAALDEVVALFDPQLERSLRDVMWAEPGSADEALLHQTGYTQPALFALEWSLARLWSSWGVEPELLLGHSIGELVAACIAGVFSLSDAARLVGARARLMQRLPRGGAMVAVAAAEADVQQLLQIHAPRVAIAAVNGLESTVISGAESEVLGVAQRLAARGVQTKRLPVSHAFHSALMEPMLEELRSVASSIDYQAPEVAIVANLSGQLAGDELCSADYWVRQVREPVRFAQGAAALYAAGARTFIELGPKPTLLGLVPGAGVPDDCALLASLRSGRGESQALLQALGEWVVQGGFVDWSRVFPAGGRRVALPTYPWQRQRYWLELPGTTRAGSSRRLASALRELASRGSLSAAAQAALPEIAAALAAADASTEQAASAASWAHELAWQRLAPAQPPASSQPASAQSWIIVGAPAEANALSLAFGRARIAATVVQDLAELRGLLGSVSKLGGIVHVLRAGVREEAAVLGLERLLASQPTVVRCWWVTRGAVGTRVEDPPAEPEHAVVWGLGRTFALEHPQSWGGLIDVSAREWSAVVADQLATLLAGSHGEDQLALRGTEVFVPRLRSVALGSGGPPLALRGTALITGGLGGIGLRLARRLAERGTPHLMLLGRTGLAAPGVPQAVAELQALGARVTVVAADVSKRAELSQALAQIPAELPLTAVFHAAGVSDKTPLEELTPEHLSEVLAAKRDGLLGLADLTAGMPLDWFVCFSSIAGVWGAGRQAAYAAANAFLDAWAQRARAQGIPAFSIAWGPWHDVGMADAESLAQLERRGLRALPAQLALDTLEQALAEGRTHTVVADVDWARFRVGFEAWGPRKLLEGLGPAGTYPQAAQGSAVVAEAVAKLGPRAAQGYLRNWLAEQCAAVLGHQGTQRIGFTRGFFDLGFDSLMVVELRRRLERGIGRRVAASVIFSHPNIEALSQHLLQELLPVAAPTEVLPPAAEVQPSAATPPQSAEELISFINSRFEVEDERG